MVVHSFNILVVVSDVVVVAVPISVGYLHWLLLLKIISYVGVDLLNFSNC